MHLESKLPRVGTTIFSVMSRLAEQTGALNLGQGFPDFEPPALFAESLQRHVKAGKNQYAPMPGVPRLLQQIAKQLGRDYGAQIDPESCIGHGRRHGGAVRRDHCRRAQRR
jgi:methionine aminotransferase